MNSTFSERGARPARQVRLLTYVLSYDDLLADRSVTFAIDHGALPLTLGRAPDGESPRRNGPSELRFPDRWASSTHCAILSLGGQDVLCDQGSRNGTWVNGARVERHPLTDGDVFEAGHSLWCYRRVDEALARPLVEDPRGVTFGLTRTLSPRVASLAGELARVAPSREPVLILGETGTGKESAAESVHTASGRAGAFRAVDCGAVPDGLFESTFFGHRKGAFTGAHEARAGEVSLADGGTLFLDEVANLGAQSQARLLRVLEDGRVTPLGAAGATRADVRWVAATNRDLFDDRAGFREDLLRRLAGYVLRLPALRERREDLGALTAHLLRAAGVRRASITAAAGRTLFTNALTGNVRQLRTALRAAATLAGEHPIDLGHLPPLDVAARTNDTPAESRAAATRARDEVRPDARAVEAALEATRGNVVRAAERLGAHPRQLYRWIERYTIDLGRFRP